MMGVPANELDIFEYDEVTRTIIPKRPIEGPADCVAMIKPYFDKHEIKGKDGVVKRYYSTFYKFAENKTLADFFTCFENSIDEKGNLKSGVSTNTLAQVAFNFDELNKPEEDFGGLIVLGIPFNSQNYGGVRAEAIFHDGASCMTFVKPNLASDIRHLSKYEADKKDFIEKCKERLAKGLPGLREVEQSINEGDLSKVAPILFELNYKIVMEKLEGWPADMRSAARSQEEMDALDMEEYRDLITTIKEVVSNGIGKLSSISDSDKEKVVEVNKVMDKIKALSGPKGLNRGMITNLEKYGYFTEAEGTLQAIEQIDSLKAAFTAFNSKSNISNLLKTADRKSKPVVERYSRTKERRERDWAAKNDAITGNNLDQSRQFQYQSQMASRMGQQGIQRLQGEYRNVQEACSTGMFSFYTSSNPQGLKNPVGCRRAQERYMGMQRYAQNSYQMWNQRSQMYAQKANQFRQYEDQGRRNIASAYGFNSWDEYQMNEMGLWNPDESWMDDYSMGNPYIQNRNYNDHMWNPGGNLMGHGQGMGNNPFAGQPWEYGTQPNYMADPNYFQQQGNPFQYQQMNQGGFQPF
jgi:hypothetical protein